MPTSAPHQPARFCVFHCSMAKLLGTLLVIGLCLPAGRAQPAIGQNLVASFTRKQYGAGTQNWAMQQDQRGRLYIANNEGLLLYNGTNWQLYPVPNKTIVRSLGLGPGGRLYAGAQDELGYYEPDQVGRLRFTSLKQLLPQAYRTFTDVWQLEVVGTTVYFRTDAAIFRLEGQQMQVYPAASSWLSIQQHQGQVLAHDRRGGLMIYQQQRWQPFIGPNQLPANWLMTDIVPYAGDTSLVSTVSHGLWLLTANQLLPFGQQASGYNSRQHFTALATLPDGSLLAGTYFNGIYHLAKDGTLLDHVSAANGMPNNTVRCLFADRNGNAWAGLDNGLAAFSYLQAIKQINPAVFNNGFGYDAKVLNGYLYFALSTGLQCLQLPAGADIGRLAGTPQSVLPGLTWQLSVVNNQLLAGRDDGLYAVSADKGRPLWQSTGFWGARAFGPPAGGQLVAGNYLGLQLFSQGPGGFEQVDTLASFTESSRYLETDGNTIWVSHPYRGVYRIQLPEKKVQLFTEKDGLPSRLDNHVFKIRNQIVFATAAGIYEYNASSQRLQPAPAYQASFGQRPIRYLKEDGNGNIWFVQNKMMGVLLGSGPQARLHYIPELTNKILSGFENIYPLDSRNVLVGADAGFYHINFEAYLKSLKPFAAYLTQVKTTGGVDSVLLGGYQPDSDSHAAISIPFRLNSLLFSFAATAYYPQHQPQYSYYLQGFDDDWSDWSSEAQKEYTNLPAGTYQFQVKARHSPSHVSAVYQFSFSVEPPWYQSLWARLLYILAAAGALYGILKYQSRRHRRKLEARRQADRLRFEEEQKQTAYQYQLELAKSEKELIRLQNEKLEADIQHKNSELASTTMNLVQKKEFILKLKAELTQLQKNARLGDDQPELKKLLRALAEEEKLDDEWEQFSQHFNNVHGDFLTKLKNSHPALKPHELRLCVYLRMNLSSKEIAPLMSISVRGVEISRYRLRKKMALPTEVNLTQYLMEM